MTRAALAIALALLVPWGASPQTPAAQPPSGGAAPPATYQPPPAPVLPPAPQSAPSAAPAPTEPQAAPAPAPAQPQTAPAPAPAQPQRKSHPMSLALVVGGGSAYGQSYFLVGGRFGYGIGLGFQLSLDGQWWTGATPALGKVAPGVIWVAPLPFRPYLGAYYAHWFVGSDLPDDDAVGGRVGLHLGGAGPAMLAIGVAYERVLSCQAQCDSWWPEFMAGVSF